MGDGGFELTEQSNGSLPAEKDEPGAEEKGAGESPPVQEPVAKAPEKSDEAPERADKARPAPPQENGRAENRQPQANCVVVRYGAMRILGLFRHKLDAVRSGRKVIVKTDRGLELGELVCRSHTGIKYQGKPLKSAGRVLRQASEDDLSDVRHLGKDAKREFAFCLQEIKSRKLPMKLVYAEHIFGGDRIVFYFVAEKRVDFRALVRDVAQEFHTRVEMHQIGVRDEARLLGDHERCGRPLCCRAWLKSLEPVTIKMAKIQKPTLDPAKISGRCGRLMCCLRFEDTTYEELSRTLPPRGTRVETEKGHGTVVDRDILTQTVVVRLKNDQRISVPVETLKTQETPADNPEKKHKS
ncbi:MAG: regulatory iron-sulfur-containing complex subunit RicT [Phycisphaerae bacterium]|jgi:cell fate regulator YaaT (PSP1 superfamily)|nr:regulatory iron-sulfur-containing complex subunit RicT [Phycisphaerae bacterium]